jgi:hypothetical protein
MVAACVAVGNIWRTRSRRDRTERANLAAPTPTGNLRLA